MNAYMSYKVSTQVHKALPYYYFFGLDKLFILKLCPFSMLLSRLHCPCSIIRLSQCVDVSVISWDFMRRCWPNTPCWAASSHLHLRRAQWVKKLSCSLWLFVQWSYSSEPNQTLCKECCLSLASYCCLSLASFYLEQSGVIC